MPDAGKEICFRCPHCHCDGRCTCDLAGDLVNVRWEKAECPDGRFAGLTAEQLLSSANPTTPALRIADEAFHRLWREFHLCMARARLGG